MVFHKPQAIISNFAIWLSSSNSREKGKGDPVKLLTWLENNKGIVWEALLDLLFLMNLIKIIKLQNLILSLVVYEKLNHLIFIHKIVTWHRVHASLLWYFSHSFSFFFINCFIASIFLFMPLPHSLPIYLSQTTTISISISCSISLLPSWSLLFCYWFSISHSLFHFQSPWRNLWL